MKYPTLSDSHLHHILQPVSRNNSVFHHLNLSGNCSKKDIDLLNPVNSKSNCQNYCITPSNGKTLLNLELLLLKSKSIFFFPISSNLITIFSDDTFSIYLKESSRVLSSNQ